MSDRYMLFTLHEQRYAVEVEAVAEIAEMLPLYPIPFAPSFMRGVANIHGKLAAVLDLALFLGMGAATNGRNLLLFSRPETALALMVDQVERIIYSEEVLFRGAGTEALEQARLTLSDGPVSLLALESLLAAVEEVLER